MNDMYGRYSVEKSSGSVLSADEVRLLETYRSLNQQGQEYILQTIAMAATVYKKVDRVSNLEEQIG